MAHEVILEKRVGGVRIKYTTSLDFAPWAGLEIGFSSANHPGGRERWTATICEVRFEMDADTAVGSFRCPVLTASEIRTSWITVETASVEDYVSLGWEIVPEEEGK